MSEPTKQIDVSARRVGWVEHRGVRILCVDLSGIEDPGELREIAERGHQAVRQEPLVSVLSLIILRGVRLTFETVPVLRDVAARNAPYIRARALVGLPSIASMALRSFMLRTGRDMQSFRTEDEAKGWLAEQAEQ